MPKIIPIGDNIVVEPVTEEVSSSGIIIPDTASKERPMKGKVIAAGPGKMKDDGSRIDMEISEGDVVLFSKYGPSEFKLDGKDVLIISAGDVYGKLA
ncbi:co-chaperone GroES [Candidatus Peregrinibacteria bacterium CG10_big_fil_rev_8_21_14_0_10_36_19]|nr:MAG: co-chaperone GroES [Candidatus Peregrinibacteria bacterium CG10_big_fil_rev_8_21_14_0_10_36_19]